MLKSLYKFKFLYNFFSYQHDNKAFKSNVKETRLSSIESQPKKVVVVIVAVVFGVYFVVVGLVH